MVDQTERFAALCAAYPLCDWLDYDDCGRLLAKAEGLDQDLRNRLQLEAVYRAAGECVDIGIGRLHDCIHDLESARGVRSEVVREPRTQADAERLGRASRILVETARMLDMQRQIEAAAEGTDLARDLRHWFALSEMHRSFLRTLGAVVSAATGPAMPAGNREDRLSAAV